MKNLSICLSLMLLVVSRPLFAEDTDDTNNEPVKVNGVILDIAKDRKVEKIGGIYQPEGIDKYVERRIDTVTDRLSLIEKQIAETNQKLDDLSNQIRQLAAGPVAKVEATPNSSVLSTSSSSSKSSPPKKANIFQ